MDDEREMAFGRRYSTFTNPSTRAYPPATSKYQDVERRSSMYEARPDSEERHTMPPPQSAAQSRNGSVSYHATHTTTPPSRNAQAAAQAGTRGIEFDEYGDMSMEMAGDEITNAFKPWAQGQHFAAEDQENNNPFDSVFRPGPQPGDDEDEGDDDMSMDMTRAVGRILPQQQPQDEQEETEDEGDMTMDMTKPMGTISPFPLPTRRFRCVPSACHSAPPLACPLSVHLRRN